MPRTSTEDLLRQCAPQALGAVVRRYGDFAGAEDAVQEALLVAATRWPDEGVPDNPVGWLVRSASRRLVDQYRQDDARRRREDLAASWSMHQPEEPVAGTDDTLTLMFLCCHRALTPGAAIPLTLRAVGGLTTREIAAAFLVPEATMAQRISRAKAKVAASDEPFELPEDLGNGLRLVLHVLYLLFNEGYATSAGPDLARADLSDEAIRLARMVAESLPDEPEVAGLLALMLLTEARRVARTDELGELVPLADQDRSRWDRSMVADGMTVLTAALRRGRPGEYQLQAAITGLHDEARRYEDTRWDAIVPLYDRLEQLSGNPMVTLNKAVAVAMVDGPAAGLTLLDGLEDRVGDHHRLHSARAHLHELAGDVDAALAGFRAAAARTDNLRERNYLTLKAARLAQA
jgi:RNA polymerase sigma factor (sigma-70 family)